GYTGREMLVNTWGGLGAGLYDYRNRIYSTVHGRFLQPDPIGFEAEDVNWCRYVGNNAVNYTDPEGLFISHIKCWMEIIKWEKNCKDKIPKCDCEKMDLLEFIECLQKRNEAIAKCMADSKNMFKECLKATKVPPARPRPSN
ncbi:MAG: RHS repeat-associated core domain-containing protein, partial [Methylacidiphilales bacterium]|nr:RHS repeat-associated core domain-containing protein [Candidatus Methylacidiphilales bacterium]